MAPFQPAGEQPRWRVIYELLLKAEVGDTVTYEEMGEALALDPDDGRHSIQMAVRRAAYEHEVVDNRVLDAVPNVGYRVVHAPEQIALAQRDQRKAGRSLARGRSKVEHVDISGLDPQTRRAFEVMAVAFKMQAEFNKRLDVRQKRLERQVDAAVAAQGHTSEEIADLRARLERLEAGQDPGR